jgi:type II secretory pathway pseudopilin PulG
MRARATGFTLLEVLAVVLLTAIVIGLALDFYMDLSRDTLRATNFTRDIRRATAILDRVARDFQRTVLLDKAQEEDPLAHPWLFLGESRSSALGADHVKFNTLHQSLSGSDLRESGFAVVAYLTRADLDSDSIQLLRWSWPRLPESLDRDFPLPEDDGVLLLADGLAEFGVRFLGEDGEWRDSWDSSQLEQSGLLPVAVEIELAMAPSEGEPLSDAQVTYSRLVPLPLRPFARTALTGEDLGAAGDGEGGEDGDGSAGGDANDPLARLRAALTGGDARSREGQDDGPLDPRALHTGLE